MKKKYTFIFTLIIVCISVYSQPVLNQSDFTSYYIADSYSANDVVSLSPGNAGANQTWNLSGLTALSLRGTFSIVPYNTSPYASTFPSANYVFKTTSVGEPNPDYIYFKLTSTVFETAGSADINGANLEVDHSIFFQFPYTYNTVINDTYQYDGDPEIYSFTSTYDGYGTLITPYATFTNVIRQKKIQVDGDYTQTDYIWFTTNPFKYIMSMGFYTSGTFSGNYVEVLTNFSTLGLDEFNKKSIVHLYPNPATSELSLQLPNNISIDKIVVVDISGKTVFQKSGNINQISVDNLPSGVYILESYSGKDKFINKFIKE